MRIVSRDSRSVTCRNVDQLTALTGLSPWDYSGGRIKEKLPKLVFPDGDWWRRGLLLKFLEMRGKVADPDHLDKLVDSLCSTRAGSVMTNHG